MSVLLDTHVWIWWLTPQAELSKQAREALDRTAEQGEVFLSVISLWEAQMLNTKRRIRLPIPFPEWLRRAAAPDVLTVLPLDAEAVITLDSLSDRFHGDPADRLIVATARAHRLPLATYDKAIRRSRLVKLWKP